MAQSVAAGGDLFWIDLIKYFPRQKEFENAYFGDKKI